MTTASRKATAFSLIRMVGFPCFVVVGEPGRSAEGGERRPPRPAHHIHMFAQYSISHETENNSSPQSKKAITRAAGMAFGAAGSEAGQLETRPPVQGGGGGGRVSFAACRRVARAVTGEEGQRGGRAGQSFQSAGGQPDRSACVAGNASLRICAELERRLRAASLDGQVVVRRIEFKCENTNPGCADCNKLRCIPRKTAAGSLRRPLHFQRLDVAQLAATSRPLRWRRAATRSTSARAAVRPSATHLLSTAERVCV